VRADTGADTDAGAGGGTPETGAAGVGVAVGVGNPTMGDDGLGRAVVRRLEAVPAAYTGTTAFLALEAMSGADRAVVIDAVDAEAPPGTVVRYRLGTEGPAPETTMHDLTFGDALGACGAAYDLPERVVLVGVVPAAVETGVGLSEPVERSLPAAAAAVRAELGRRPRHGASESDGHDGGTHDMDATWYCQDCEQRIDADEVDDHEGRGHSVRGHLRPERLLSQDPWETSGGER
jgi:hydrogenase maturation protease